LPVRVVDDSMFPLKCEDSDSMPVKVSFRPNDNKIVVEKWVETDENKTETDKE